MPIQKLSAGMDFTNRIALSFFVHKLTQINTNYASLLDFIPFIRLSLLSPPYASGQEFKRLSQIMR